MLAIRTKLYQPENEDDRKNEINLTKFKRKNQTKRLIRHLTHKKYLSLENIEVEPDNMKFI